MKKGMFTELQDIIDLKYKKPGFRKCPVCGESLKFNPNRYKDGQWAHFLCRTKTHYQIYGKRVIDSFYNGVTACDLKCNNAVQLNIKSQPILCDELAEWIEEMEDLKDET